MIVMDLTMFVLFLPLEQYVGLSTLTVSELDFFFFSGCMLKFSSEFVCHPFSERGISTSIWISRILLFRLKMFSYSIPTFASCFFFLFIVQISDLYASTGTAIVL
jgi:hypothetical protein